jgi:hypothetical protein
MGGWWGRGTPTFFKYKSFDWGPGDATDFFCDFSETYALITTVMPNSNNIKNLQYIISQ